MASGEYLKTEKESLLNCLISSVILWMNMELHIPESYSTNYSIGQPSCRLLIAIALETVSVHVNRSQVD